MGVVGAYGSSVLLIDGDMRKPVQHRTFEIKNDEGLSTLIIKKFSMAKSVKSNVIDNLDLLPSRPLPPNPSELLASETFKKLLEQFATNYEYVIIYCDKTEDEIEKIEKERFE